MHDDDECIDFTDSEDAWFVAIMLATWTHDELAYAHLEAHRQNDMDMLAGEKWPHDWDNDGHG